MDEDTIVHLAERKRTHVNLPSKLGDSLALFWMGKNIGPLNVTSGGDVPRMVRIYKEWFGLDVEDANDKLNPSDADIDCNREENHHYFWKMSPATAVVEIPVIDPHPYITMQLNGARAQQTRDIMKTVKLPERYKVYCIGYPGQDVRPGGIPFHSRLEDVTALIYHSSCHITVASFTAKLGAHIGTPTIQVHYDWPDANESWLAYLGEYGYDVCGKSEVELEFTIRRAMRLIPEWKKKPPFSIAGLQELRAGGWY